MFFIQSLNLIHIVRMINGDTVFIDVIYNDETITTIGIRLLKWYVEVSVWSDAVEEKYFMQSSYIVDYILHIIEPIQMPKIPK